MKNQLFCNYVLLCILIESVLSLEIGKKEDWPIDLCVTKPEIICHCFFCREILAYLVYQDLQVCLVLLGPQASQA